MDPQVSKEVARQRLVLYGFNELAGCVGWVSVARGGNHHHKRRRFRPQIVYSLNFQIAAEPTGVTGEVTSLGQTRASHTMLMTLFLFVVTDSVCSACSSRNVDLL